MLYMRREPGLLMHISTQIKNEFSLDNSYLFKYSIEQ
jgi:hypothetical protein